MMKSKGFTLIELLVVIAIIAILAAITFPVFASAREKARQTTCASNMKQISLAILQYTQDFDENVPIGVGGNVCTGWASQVYPYVKSTGAFKCPDDPTAVTIAGDAVVSYAFNCDFNRLNVGGGGIYHTKIATWKQPVKTILLFEVQGNNSNITGANGANENDSPAGNGYPDNGGINGQGYGSTLTYATGILGNDPNLAGNAQYPSSQLGVHTQGSNYAFCDGHVKYMKSNYVSYGTPVIASTDYQERGGGNGDGSTYCAAGTANITFAGSDYGGTGPIYGTFSPE